MKNPNPLTTVELMDMIASNLREMNSMEITDRRLPSSINRSNATAKGCQSALKIAIYDAKHNAEKVSTSKKILLADKAKNGKVRLLK